MTDFSLKSLSEWSSGSCVSSCQWHFLIQMHTLWSLVCDSYAIIVTCLLLGWELLGWGFVSNAFFYFWLDFAAHEGNFILFLLRCCCNPPSFGWLLSSTTGVIGQRGRCSFDEFLFASWQMNPSHIADFRTWSCRTVQNSRTGWSGSLASRNRRIR